MEKYQCPAAAGNQRAHAEFLARFGELNKEWRTRGMDPALVNDTFKVIMGWIMNHIQGVDTRLNQSIPPPRTATAS